MIPRFGMTTNPRSMRHTGRCESGTKKLRGRSSRLLFLLCLVSCYFFFFADFFAAFFLVAIFLFSLSIVQSSSQRSFVAIVECIESLKNYVKQKMVDGSCSLSSTSRKKVRDEGRHERFAMHLSEHTQAKQFFHHLITPLFISFCAIIRKIP